jgi:hypothetical protein
MLQFSSPHKRHLGLALACSLFLSLVGCQKLSDDLQPIGADAIQGAKGSQQLTEAKEPQNKGKYMYFASVADFQRTIKELGTPRSGEEETARLEKWEKKYGFNSMRAHYAKLKKDKKTVKAKADLSAPALQNMVVPVDGEHPVDDPYTPVEPPFVPYEEPWDEGLIIEDDVFAAMVSPDGTVQIDGKLFHLDLANNIVSYISATPTVSTKTTYEQFIVADPTVANDEIRCYSMEDDVFAGIDAGHTGTAFGESFLTIGLGSGIGCGSGADREKDSESQYYEDRRRLDCKVVYQKLGIYFSIVAKAHHQKKVWFAWVGSPSGLYLTTPNGALHEPKCDGVVLSDFRTYNNISALGVSRENGDDNTVVKRYYSNTKGLKRYKVEVQFQVQYVRGATRVFRIQSKW